MGVETDKHIVIFPAHMWGHARTACTLVARLVRLRPVTVTFFAANNFYDRVKVEIARDFLPGEEHYLSRIRLIGLDEGKETFVTTGLQESFEAAWAKTVKADPVICAKTGIRFDPHPTAPTVGIFDLFVHRAFEVVEELSGDSVKTYAWLPGATNVMPLILRQASDPVEETETVPGLPARAAAFKHFLEPTGQLIRSPCAPPMYDYEWHPQAFPHPPDFIINVMSHIPEICRRCSGMLTLDAADYHPEATSVLRAWFAETGRGAYYAGPLIPRVQEDTSQDPRSDKVLKFLNEKLGSHGPQSVVYISFGSLFWPMDPTKLWAVLDVLIERNVPFVMSSAAASSTSPPADVQARISSYEHALVTDWVPQQALLDHAATGWFLSHGGHNSTLETIMAGVPSIVWPVDADQPMNAIHLSEDLDVAYELIEVRHGTGLGKIYRNGRKPIGTIEAVKKEMHDVLDRAYGEDGAKKRAKLQVLRKTLQNAWAEDGVARRDVEAFLDEI